MISSRSKRYEIYEYKMAKNRNICFDSLLQKKNIKAVLHIRAYENHRNEYLMRRRFACLIRLTDKDNKVYVIPKNKALDYIFAHKCLVLLQFSSDLISIWVISIQSLISFFLKLLTVDNIS